MKESFMKDKINQELTDLLVYNVFEGITKGRLKYIVGYNIQRLRYKKFNQNYKEILCLLCNRVENWSIISHAQILNQNKMNR